MTRLMYDSDVAADIPADAQMVAGYLDIWSAEEWARFPHAVKVHIARFDWLNGDVLDVESTLATPGQAPAWVQRQRARGSTPCVYTSASNWQACRDAFAAAAVPEPLWWIASYQSPNDPSIPAGAIAHQYASPAYGSGGHWDLSTVVDYWPGVDPDPPPRPHRRKRSMFDPIYIGTPSGHYVVDSDGQAQAVQSGPTDGSEIAMTSDEFNALLTQRQKSFAALVASGKAPGA